MANWQQEDSLWRSVILYGTAALIILSLLPGCSMLSSEPQKVEAELTQVEKVAVLKKRLLETHHKLHMQRAQLQKLINNDADLEQLIRLMHIRQQQTQLSGDAVGQTKEVTVDYLQVMAANQQTLKSDLARLVSELNTLKAAPGN
ncbi:MAG: hypothetical protein KJ556_15985 [Gammaproteobacteria bacterium]|nr:hypothetical protein [Gammaproteobacteria bacterium]MBU2058331.1 hypothetical protein [Gammaproteobacteria bacterium]MBU2176616.1 hypothetical protein [Gammaproteobacteria bacterium]MBU2248442.1 hypothetical protein [Gammaproteobacteria bacterium]MBU2345695.1 hypothetical protein [Gammaproteobacteria bacterium]